MYMNYFFFREKYIPLLEKVLFPQIFLRNKTSLKNVQLYTGSTPIKLHLNNEFCLRDTDSDNACYGWRHQCSFPGSSAGKESACNVGDPGSIPGSGRSPGEGIGYQLQYSWVFLVAQMVKKFACNVGDLGSIPGMGRSPVTPVVLPGESHGQRILVGYSPWCCRVRHK